MSEQSRNMFEGMFGIHEKDEAKSKGGGKPHNKKKEEQINKVIEYSEKERSYINKYLKIAKNAYDEKEIYELVKKYNFDDDLINKDIKKQLDMIQVKGDEYGWSEVKKKEIKPKENIIIKEKENDGKKFNDKNKKEKEKKKDFKGKLKGKNINEKINKEKKENKDNKKEDTKEDEEYNNDEYFYERALSNDHVYDKTNNMGYNNYEKNIVIIIKAIINIIIMDTKLTIIIIIIIIIRITIIIIKIIIIINIIIITIIKIKKKIWNYLKKIIMMM